MTHRGWTVTYHAGHPVTGQWRARRWGVGMCAGDKASLLRMIDAR
jgi:hypothetical protein